MIPTCRYTAGWSHHNSLVQVRLLATAGTQVQTGSEKATEKGEDAAGKTHYSHMDAA